MAEGPAVTGLRKAATADVGTADLLVVHATLTAGASPTDALLQTRAVALGAVRSSLRAGEPLTQIAGHGGGRSAGGPAAAALVRALAVAEAVGAPAGPAVEQVLAAVRADLRLTGLIAVRSAQAVTSSRFLIALPLAGALGLAAFDPAARRFFASAVGVAVVALAAVLIGLATLWIRRLVGAVAHVDPLGAPARSGPHAVHLAVGGTAMIAWLANGPAAAFAVLVVLGGCAPTVRRWLDARDDDEHGNSPPDAVDAVVVTETPGALPTVEGLELMALAMSAGVDLAEATRLAARLGPPESAPVLTAVAGRLSAGLDVAEAFPPRLAELVHLIEVTRHWGAPTAEALRLLAGEIRDRAAVAAEGAAERLTVQLVFPTTLLLVPAFGLLVVTPMVASSLSTFQLGP
jgi:Flp pilus assembly protein TadB